MLGPMLNVVRRQFAPAELTSRDWLPAVVRSGASRSSDLAEERAIASLGPMTSILHKQFPHIIQPIILRNLDRAPMANGGYVRMPFMDWQLATFVFSLPDASKVGGGFTKRVFREAMRGIIPEELRIRHNKIGSNSPTSEWFAGPIRDWIWDQVHDPEFLRCEHWRGATVRQFVADRRWQGNWTWADVRGTWTILNTSLWNRAFLGRTGGLDQR